MLAAAEGDVLIGLWFIGQKYFPKDASGWNQSPGEPVFKALQLWLDGYFGKKVPRWTLPLKPRGTVSQQTVWKILREIPSGGISTYGAIADRLGGKSAQAVGGAVGHNPISLIIPCHRVLGKKGASYSLTGYAGGLDKKRALLELEGYHCFT
jgi:methylated-DNA-[protein]-cysteine S-methyltransferase